VLTHEVNVILEVSISESRRSSGGVLRGLFLPAADSSRSVSPATVESGVLLVLTGHVRSSHPCWYFLSSANIGMALPLRQ
jgi:hypothetical protein